MKVLLLIVPLLMFPLSLAAHPGKTDAYGGHKCLKDCADWDLYYGEYHTHDKEGRPVKVARIGQPKKKRTRKVVAVVSAPAQTVPADPVTVPPAAPVAVPPASAFPASTALWLTLLLLLLVWLLVLRRRRGRHETRKVWK